MKLVQHLQIGCNKCNLDGFAHQQLWIVNNKITGATLELKLKCQCCGNEFWWFSSFQYLDGSFQVNRDIARATLTSGAEKEEIFRFLEFFRCGIYNRSSFDQTCKFVENIIFEEEDRLYRINIKEANRQVQSEKKGTTIGFDCQHSRPQRSFGPSLYATTTFINHTPGLEYKQILYQSHVSKQLLKEAGLVGTESKDKITTDNGLEVLVQELQHIATGICDMSSSGQIF